MTGFSLPSPLPRPHRPAGLTTQATAPGHPEETPGVRGEMADDLADRLLALGAEDPAGALRVTDELGVVELGEAWSAAEPASVPGLLWALHLVRTWCQFSGAEAARLYGAGRRAAAVDDAVAGVPPIPSAEDLNQVGEAVLLTAYAGDLAAAADRAAALLRVTAAGREQLVDEARSPAERTDALRQAARARTSSERLVATARAWRAGHLH